MWELNRSGSYFKWEGKGEDRDLVASLIHHIAERDGHPCDRWGVQIHTEDGGLVIIGYIPEADFDARAAQILADRALLKKASYERWLAAGSDWFNRNWKYVVSESAAQARNESLRPGNEEKGK